MLVKDMERDTLTQALSLEIQQKEGTPAALPLFEVYEEIGSTNDRAAALAREGVPSGSFVTAEHQWGGRGRRGRSWESPAGSNIAVSFIFRPEKVLNDLSQITLAAAMAVHKAILRQSGLKTLIKWPNDILAGERKLCGILTELVFGPDRKPLLIVGIGINVRASAKSPELAGTASSLEEEGAGCSREALLAALWAELTMLESAWEKCGDLSFLKADYESVMAWRGEECVLKDADGEKLRGSVRGITKEGHLLIGTSDGISEVSTGELSLRRVK